MSETEIAELNERVARALGWKRNENLQGGWWREKPYGNECRLPDFYHDIGLCGEMLIWLAARKCFWRHETGVTFDTDHWMVVVEGLPMGEGCIECPTLNECLCRAIDAIAKGRET